jgi:IS5 family transposase
MRTDGTVVATNIHFPSDNSLLVDGVRVLTRLLQQARQLLLQHKCSVNAQFFRNRHRTARRISRRIDSLSRTRTQRGSEQRKKAYEKLLEVSQASLKQAQGVQKLLQNLKSLPTEKLSQAFRLFLPRVVQVIDQTYRRVFLVQKVPSSEKIVSLFESHTDIICRGKTNVLVEFGHKVWLDEVDGGIINNYRVLYGNPHDTQQWCESLEQHQQQFSHPPQQASADRGVFSQFNETFAKDLGVQQIILPKSGYKSGQRQQHEKQRYFRQGRYWHNGVEGRISYLKRTFGFQRCLCRGKLGFERWVCWGVIAHNLTIISRTLVQKNQSRFKPN